MANAQQLVNHVDALMTELVTEEHAKRHADDGASAIQQRQEKEFGQLNMVTQQYEGVEGGLSRVRVETK